jgi:gliding motility-associated-like protein
MSNTCSGTDVANVSIGSTLNITATSATICPGGTATLTASGATTYQWSTGQQTATILVAPISNSTYTVTGTNSGCIGTTITSVIVNDKPNANLSPSVTITQGSSTSLLASGGASYTWTPADGLSCTNCQDPVASPTVQTKYCVALTSSAGCSDTACTLVLVENKEISCGDIFVPTAFTPNGDGVNDVACVLGNCIVSVRFIIFDRWGEKVFEGTSVADKWDGTLHGQPMNTAVFVYSLKVTLSNGEHVSQKGNITLIR